MMMARPHAEWLFIRARDVQAFRRADGAGVEPTTHECRHRRLGHRKRIEAAGFCELLGNGDEMRPALAGDVRDDEGSEQAI